jgi:hypothetical protein
LSVLPQTCGVRTHLTCTLHTGRASPHEGGRANGSGSGGLLRLHGVLAAAAGCCCSMGCMGMAPPAWLCRLRVACVCVWDAMGSSVVGNVGQVSFWLCHACHSQIVRLVQFSYAGDGGGTAWHWRFDTCVCGVARCCPRRACGMKPYPADPPWIGRVSREPRRQAP